MKKKQFTFKACILGFDEKTRSYIVNFYTDRLLADFEKNELPERIENVKQSDASLDDAAAEERAREQWFPGEVRSITIYEDPPPAGQALLDYLMRQVPRAMLQHRERCLRSATFDHSHMGKELEVAVDHDAAPSPTMPVAMRVTKG